MTLWHTLFSWFPRQRLRLGEARRLSGDVVISFCGTGEARFRVQHTRDRFGKPDELGWCDVSALSDSRLNQFAAYDKGEHLVRGLFVDVIKGDREAIYRHYKAAWLRVIPAEDDAATRKQCAAYAISLRPAA